MLSTADLCELPLQWGTQKGCMEERVKADDRLSWVAAYISNQR